MQKYADYIEEIEIDSLWSGKKHIRWTLDRQVNILSGINGVGKSTILNKVVRGLSQGGEFPSHLLKGVRLKVSPDDAKWIRYDIIRSFDRPLMNSDSISKMDTNLSTELDWQLFQLQRKYLDYQVNIGNRIIAALQSGEADSAEKAQLISTPKSVSRILLTTFSRRLVRLLSVQRMRFGSHRWVKNSSLISYPAEKSRCLSSCLPYWWKTMRTMCSSWMSQK